MASAPISRSIITFLTVAAVTALILLVAGGLFAVSIGKEHFCNGVVRMTEYGVNVPAQLQGYCTYSR